MKLTVHSYKDGDMIPVAYAFCVPADEGHVSMGQNKNPHVSWEDPPSGTRSFALILHDPDVPSKPDDVNQEGKTVPKDLERMDFFHWVVIDIPTTVNMINLGTDSDGITPRGKAPGKKPYGLTGVNSYTDWFKGDEQMEGIYGGYDVPCPPWNDELMHRYIITLYALDVPNLGLSGNFTGPDALKAIEGHVLDKKEWMGKYTLNKGLL
ncbi:MAG: YbhB/YbcL family Raf kinase inhibitor-like protein [Bacteroidota bacterium]